MAPKHKPLHILMIIDAWFPFTGGGQVHVHNLSQTLTRLYRHQVTILHSPSPHLFYRFFWTLFTVIPVTLRLRRHRIDLIHSHGILPGLTGKLISLFTSIPIVHTVHGSHLMDLGPTTLKAHLEKFILTRIPYSGQITVSANFLSYPNVNSRITVIRNGVNLQAFDSIKPSLPRHPTILCVARDHPHKGISYLLQAHAKLKRLYPNLKLRLISSGLSGTELIKAYKSATIFVLPSLAEGQPIVILEAWAARLPVIVTRVGDNPHLIQPRINGLLVDPADTDQLAHTIQTLLDQPRLAKRLGQAGYSQVKTHYTWNKVANATHKFYLQVLQ